jgi:hypothetical protein
MGHQESGHNLYNFAPQQKTPNTKVDKPSPPRRIPGPINPKQQIRQIRKSPAEYQPTLNQNYRQQSNGTPKPISSANKPESTPTRHRPNPSTQPAEVNYTVKQISKKEFYSIANESTNFTPKRAQENPAQVEKTTHAKNIYEDGQTGTESVGVSNLVLAEKKTSNCDQNLQCRTLDDLYDTLNHKLEIISRCKEQDLETFIHENFEMKQNYMETIQTQALEIKNLKNSIQEMESKFKAELREKDWFIETLQKDLERTMEAYHTKVGAKEMENYDLKAQVDKLERISQRESESPPRGSFDYGLGLAGKGQGLVGGVKLEAILENVNEENLDHYIKSRETSEGSKSDHDAYNWLLKQIVDFKKVFSTDIESLGKKMDMSEVEKKELKEFVSKEIGNKDTQIKLLTEKYDIIDIHNQELKNLLDGARKEREMSNEEAKRNLETVNSISQNLCSGDSPVVTKQAN